MPIPHPSGDPEAARELVRDRIYLQLRDAIISGVLLPGERLDEAELRTWLQVSGTPIRQALHALSLEGLVQTAPQSHTAVVAPRPEDAEPTLQTIGVLLAGATQLTLPHLGDGDRAELLKHANEVIARLTNGNVAAITQAAEELFTAMLRSCPNHVLLDVITRAAPSLSYHVSVAHQGLNADLADLAAGYQELCAALSEHDDRGAIAATKRVFRVG